MPQIFMYNRSAAVAYAHRWAYYRNPAYYNFQDIGGDCTNFASQCIYAGSGVMNFTPVYGWYYRSASDRSPSWAGVQYLYDFLTTNRGIGPFANETPISAMEPGDIVQIATIRPEIHHSPVIVRIDGEPTLETIYIATHTGDVDNRPLASYPLRKIRFIHIEGVRR
ncbi:MAG: amidase domain-containing protein [Clostridiaceae bacterium]|nr:amidase domain-containing protein [Clostridiaceae bacterium]